MKVGIDLSLRSPGLVTMQKGVVTARFFPQRKRENGTHFECKCSWEGKALDFVCTVFPRKLDCDEHLINRCTVVAESIVEAIVCDLGDSKDLPLIGMEAYAFEAVSSSATSLHELGGIVKYLFAKKGWSWTDIAPTSVKKRFAGNGKTKKDGMRDVFVRGGMPDLDKAFQLDPARCANPVQDIVDAFAVLVSTVIK
jgi:Holliday junction resolvasome RuvABC endonuclease subunit